MTGTSPGPGPGEEPGSLAAAPGGTLLEVAVLAGLGLFVELLLIRWLDAQVRVLAFARNLPLVASFLGLGIGYATSATRGRRDLVPWAAPLLGLGLLAGLVSDLPGGGTVAFGPVGIESNLGAVAASTAGELLVFAVAVAGCFAIAAAAVVPLGQAAGRAMASLPPLRAYLANLAGSIAGVLLVFALAAASAPLWANAAVAFVALLALPRFRGRRVVAAATAVACCASMAALDRREGRTRIWSPYNRIEYFQSGLVKARDGTLVPTGWTLAVQSLFYQRMIDFDLDARTGSSPIGTAKGPAVYSAPYRGRRPRSVLVLGAGSGNDVVAALRGGAERVDAVEIDPVILELGRKLHPQHPWSDPRVHAVVDDARAFLRRPGPSYDLIVFGILDAHLGFYSSLASSIRLDNYVYTVESVRQALRRLTPDGVVYMTVYIEQPWVAEHLEAAITEAWGRRPRVERGRDGATFVFGPGADRAGAAGGAPDGSARSPRDTPRDDWPFLYLKKRAIPGPVLWASLGIALASAFLVRLFFRGAFAPDRQLFLLGTGFLLVETRAIAQLALLYGTTWRVSAVAIAAILAISLAVTALVDRVRRVRAGPLYGLLVLTLLAGWLVPTGAALGRGPLALLGATVLLALPVAFSSFIFAGALRRTAGLAPALASNLAGAVLGGLLENLSLVLGISALGGVAAAVYVLSYRRD